MQQILPIFLTTILIATILNVLFKRFAIPTVIGYIFSGTMITYLFDLPHHENSTLSHLAEFGIVFLMFTIGLEFSIRHLLSMKKEVFVFGFLQLMLTGNLFGAFSHEVLGIELKSAIVIGFALALSSTAIVLKMLNERGELHSGYGRVSLGVLLFQDIAVIPILLMISLFTSQSQAVGTLLFWTMVDMAILLLIIFVVGKYLLEYFLEWVLSTDSEEIFLIATLLVVVGASYMAHRLGFTYSLGAFLAGMTLAETKFKYRIESDLISFRDILLGIFFVTIGMQIDLAIVWQNRYTVLALLVAVMLLKALLLFGALNLFLQKRTALKASLTLMQVGEFALAIFALASQNGLIDPTVNQILIVMVVLSMILTPFVINHLKKIADTIFLKEPETQLILRSQGYRNHVVICGYGPLGQKLAKKLKTLGIDYLVIEHDYTLAKLAQSAKEPMILGNAMERTVLEAAGIKEALAVVVAIENVAKTRMVVDAVTSIAPDVNTIVKVQNESHQKIIETFAVNHIVNASRVVADTILKEVLACSIKDV